MEKTGKALKMGALILGLGAVISKILGAVYRIPLVSIMGGEGVGIYQMVFPLYTVLLDFAGSAFPSAISKLVAGFKGEDAEQKSYSLFKSAQIICAVMGGLATILMIALSVPLARAQGDERAYISYIFLAPAVFFVALISCYRGYFQGKMNMKPTAISQVVEQTVKLVFGLLFASAFMPDVPLAAGGATLAVSISEAVALIYVYATYKSYRKRNAGALIYDKSAFLGNAKTLVKYAVPITLIGIAIPLSQVIDSFLIVNIVGGYRTDATALYGILSGAAMTVINLPVSVCYGVSASVIPAVSREKGGEKNAKSAMLITMLIAIPSAIAVYFSAPLIVRILFRGLNASETAITVSLIRILAPSVATLAFTQTANGALIGLGKIYRPLISLGTGIAVKIVLNLLLLPNPALNITGGAIAINACYFCACLINFILLVFSGAKNESNKTYSREYAN